MNNTVISYYQPITGDNFSKDSFQLLEKWKKNWHSKGWNPVILNETHARRNPHFNRFNNFREDSILYQSKNSAIYLKQCYFRWLAYTQFVRENGSTVWSDYDVYNESFTYKKFCSLAQNAHTLYCLSGSSGIIDQFLSSRIERLFIKVGSTNNISSIKDDQIDFKFLQSKKHLLNDMILVQSLFRSDESRMNIISSCIIGEKKEKLLNFDIFHIHGGLINPKNQERVYINMPHDTKMKRVELWDFFAQKIKKLSE